ncbi:MAG: molybdenum cofactor guanylyltransferase [Calditrichia bacterium]
MNKTGQSDITAAIIAGGKSRRFGSDKALIKFRGQRLIDRAVELALAISSKAMIITSREQHFSGVQIEQIPDIIPDCGPMAGIYTALEKAQTPWVAILPCDNRAVVAVAEGKIQSLVSLWPKFLSHELLQSIHRGELKTNQFLKERQAVMVSIKQEMDTYKPEIFFNINFRQDLENMSHRS